MGRALPTRAGGCCQHREGIHPLRGRDAVAGRGAAGRAASPQTAQIALTLPSPSKGTSRHTNCKACAPFAGEGAGIRLAHAGALWDFSTVLQCRAYGNAFAAKMETAVTSVKR